MFPDYLAFLEIRGNPSRYSRCCSLSNDVNFDPSDSLGAFLIDYLQCQSHKLVLVIRSLAQ